MDWWRDGVLYQIYVRSFADSNGDGIGDLHGILSRLDYLEWLGVDGIWLSPIHPSPNVDWGYDVADYYAVAPELGTLADLDLLVAESARRGIRVLLDLVPNHTSIAHPWFCERPDFYVWSSEIPNNWRSMFGGGPAWAWDAARDAYYLHNFAVEQADLDWWNDDVRREFDAILRFWLDRGIAGFRIDVAHALVKDRELRDDPPARDDDPAHIRRRGLREVYSMNRPEVHDVHRHWRALADECDPPRVLLGEAYVLDLAEWVRYFGSGGDELHLAFNFAFLHAPLDAERMRSIVERTEALLPPGGRPCWVGSNHDAGRLATRWAGGDERRARCALLVLLGLRGTPCLYYGDELGLTDGVVPPDRVRDVADPPRDPGRTPMPWSEGDGGWRDPWLPLTDTTRNVEEQRADPSSTLHFVRELIRVRKQFASEPYETIASPPGTWAWRRGRFTLAVNLSSGRVEVPLGGQVELTTGEAFAGVLEPTSGAVLSPQPG